MIQKTDQGKQVEARGQRWQGKDSPPKPQEEPALDGSTVKLIWGFWLPEMLKE